jgi:hypothetical protein
MHCVMKISGQMNDAHGILFQSQYTIYARIYVFQKKSSPNPGAGVGAQANLDARVPHELGRKSNDYPHATHHSLLY